MRALLSFYVLLFLNCIGVLVGFSELQRQISALAALYDATDGRNWKLSSGDVSWEFSRDSAGLYLSNPCRGRKWVGLNCTANSITQIILQKRALTGRIPSELARLTGLTLLVLMDNSLTGTIPSAIGSLSSLTLFAAHQNRLAGVLPSQIGLLSNLAFLSLSYNSFTSTIPSTFASLSSLTYLDLQFNRLSGTIPSELARLTILNLLSLGYNRLTGSISPQFGSMKSLISFFAHVNSLVGTLPSEICLLTQLGSLFLSGNALAGSLPSSIGNMKSLSRLALEQNRLEGSLPTELFQMSRLVVIALSRNSLIGSIPIAIRGMTSLTLLAIHTNRLTGIWPSELGLLTRLVFLDISSNSFIGTIPSTIGMMTSLTLCAAHLNRLSGTLPQEVGQLTRLRMLALHINSLTGSITSSIGSLISLTSFIAFDNRLTGQLPPELWKLTNLAYIGLSLNSLSGSISPLVGSMKNLKGLFIEVNRLTGSIPSTIGLLFGLENLNLMRNSLTGSFPSSIGTLKSLTALSVGRNQYTPGPFPFIWGLKNLKTLALQQMQIVGSLPREIGSLKNLTVCRLDGNRLQGSLPSEISLLKRLLELKISNNSFTGYLGVVSSFPQMVSLDVSNNSFTSSLPIMLGSLTRLVSFDASFNLLSGSIPMSYGRLGMLRDFKVANNRLSGSLPKSLCTLSSVQYIDLSDNFLKGNPPSCLSRLKNLTTLSLAKNSFSGPVRFLNSPGLVTIDISRNFLRGSLPAQVFTSLRLKNFAAASNCLGGSLPDTICQAKSLKVLVLDGLNAACSKPLFSPGNALHLTGTVTKTKLEGSIPGCLFRLPNLTTLHLAGNELPGSVPSDLVSWGMLTDVSISHNMFSGTLPEIAMGRMKNFRRFDAASNKLNGELDLLNLSPNRTILDLRINRFSGKLPKSLVTAKFVSVLEGNLFDCSSEKDLPLNDPYLKRVQCGSETFNRYMIAFTLGIFLSGILLFHFRPSWGKQLEWIDPSIEVENAQGVRQILFTMQAIRRFSIKLTIFLVVVLVPIYGILSVFYGTHADLYVWTVSAAFKSGAEPAGILLLAWVLFLASVHRHLVSQYWSGDKATSPIVTPPITLRKTKFVLQLLFIFRIVVIFSINFLFILIPNIVYVTIVSTYDSRAQISASLVLTVYKMAWGSIALPRLLALSIGVVEVYVSGHGLEAWREEYVFELTLRVFNSIIAPAVALFTVDANCFKEVLFRPPAIETSYAMTACYTWVDYGTVYNSATSQSFVELVSGTKCSDKEQILSYQPSFEYGYQCAATLLQTYSPVFFLAALLTLFGEPLLHFAARSVANRRGMFYHKGVLKILPPLMLTAAERVQMQDESRSYLIFDARATFFNILQDLIVLLSYGFSAPLLGIVVAASLATRCLRLHHLIFAFIENPENQGGGYDSLMTDCRKFCRFGHPLFIARWFLGLFSALFLAFIVFDTAGDAVGYKSAIWAPISMLLLPLAVNLFIDQAVNKQMLPSDLWRPRLSIRLFPRTPRIFQRLIIESRQPVHHFDSAVTPSPLQIQELNSLDSVNSSRGRRSDRYLSASRASFHLRGVHPLSVETGRSHKSERQFSSTSENQAPI